MAIRHPALTLTMEPSTSLFRIFGPLRKRSTAESRLVVQRTLDRDVPRRGGLNRRWNDPAVMNPSEHVPGHPWIKLLLSTFSCIAHFMCDSLFDSNNNDASIDFI